MGFDYLIFYTEASAVCIVVLSMILINDRLYRTQQETQVCFHRAIISFILYFASDACWAAILSDQFPRIRILVELVNLSNYILLGMMAYEWFMFMAASEKMAFRKSRKKRILCLLPLLISILTMIIAYIANPTFWIRENGELNGWYYPMQITVPSMYLITAFFISVFNARKVDLREEKKLYRLIGVFPIGVMAFGMLQVVSLNAPTFCFGSTIMLLFFYIQHMQALISVDALTQLNNRGQINRYMDQVHYRENTTLYIIMIDIDRFKQINDAYGHAEGDRALILVAEALKKICEGIRASVFIGRYGGDEFTLFLQNPGDAESPEQVIGMLRSALSETQRENRLPYDLNISIGYDELRGKNDTMKDCMIRADEKLYAEKRIKPGSAHPRGIS